MLSPDFRCSFVHHSFLSFRGPITPGPPIASLEKDEIFFNKEGKEGRKEGGGEDISFPPVVEKFLEVRGLYDTHIAFSLPGSLSAELFTRLSDSLQGHSHPRGSKHCSLDPSLS